MIIVPTDTPGRRTSCATCPRWASPTTGTGEPRRPRRDPLRRRAGAVREPRRQRPGDGLRARPEAPRPRPHPPRDALARPEPAGVRHAVRAGAVSRYTHGSLLAEKQMIQDWIAESDAEMQAARLLTLHAAWKMDQLRRRRNSARVEIAMIKFWGAQGALQRDRPGHPGPRLARLHHRPAARVDVPRRAGRPHLRRARRGAQGHRRPPDPASGYKPRRRCRPSTSRPAREAAAEKFADYLDVATADL